LEVIVLQFTDLYTVQMPPKLLWCHFVGGNTAL